MDHISQVNHLTSLQRSHNNSSKDQPQTISKEMLQSSMEGQDGVQILHQIFQFYSKNNIQVLYYIFIRIMLHNAETCDGERI